MQGNYYYDELDYIESSNYYETYQKDTNYNILLENTFDNVINAFRIYFFNYQSDTILKKITCYYAEKEIFSKEYDTLLGDTRDYYVTLDKEYDVSKIKIDVNIESSNKYLISAYFYNYGHYGVNNSSSKSFGYYVFHTLDSVNDTISFSFATSTEFNEFINNNISWYSNYTDMFCYYYPLVIRKYNFYDYIKKYTGKFIEKPIDNLLLDYDDKKILYDYYIQYFIEVSDEYKDNIIVNTNANIDDIIVDKKVNGNEVLFIIKIKDEKFYKKYTLDNNRKLTNSVKETTTLLNDYNKKEKTEYSSTTTSISNKIHDDSSKKIIINKYLIFIVAIMLIVYIFKHKK